jgi:hypothetical protein
MFEAQGGSAILWVFPLYVAALQQARQNEVAAIMEYLELVKRMI